MSSSTNSSFEAVSNAAYEENDRPIGRMVRVDCQAAGNGPGDLYGVIVKLSLMVEVTAPTYGRSMWTSEVTGRAELKWAEGLDEAELSLAEKTVADTFASPTLLPEIKRSEERRVGKECRTRWWQYP